MDAVGWWIDPAAPVDRLTLAERQMVEILRAFHSQADLIILDEPNSAHTDRETQALFALMQRMKSQARSFLLVSHRLDEVFSVAESFTVLRDGTHVGTAASSRLGLRQAVAMMVGDEKGSREGRRRPQPARRRAGADAAGRRGRGRRFRGGQLSLLRIAGGGAPGGASTLRELGLAADAHSH